MKKKILLPVIAVLAAGLFFIIWNVTKGGGSKIAPGTYRVTDCEAYPDAYIAVSDDMDIRFYDIDLNVLYRELMVSKVKNVRETFPMTDDEIETHSDLNAMFVDRAYKAVDLKPDKTGTALYTYMCLDETNFWGLVIEYDSVNKTIQTKRDGLILTFAKE